MHRDLRFHPSTTRNPATISKDQVASFNRCGYLKGIRILDDESVSKHRSLFDTYLATALAAGHSSSSLSSAHLKYPEVYDLMHNPTILGCVADLIGPEIIGLAAHYFCKLPKDLTTVAWHQDASYWPLTPSKTVTIWLAIDDVDIANAAMQFVSGSHLHGPLEFRASHADERTFWIKQWMTWSATGRSSMWNLQPVRRRSTPICCCTHHRRTSRIDVVAG